MTIRKKLHGILKGTPPPPQYEKMEQTSEPDMAGMLDLSYQEFETTMIHMLRALMDEVDSIQEQMAIVIREMKILKRTKEKC